MGDLEELTELWLDSNMLINLPDVGKHASSKYTQ